MMLQSKLILNANPIQIMMTRACHTLQVVCKLQVVQHQQCQLLQTLVLYDPAQGSLKSIILH